ncbi:MAG: class I SAM-dependent methyltransferase [Halobacteriales archaeon]
MDADAVLRAWHGRSGEYSPRYYAHYGPNATSEAIRERLEALLEPEAAVLELGCSSGRHLAHLQAHGFEDLSGIDINDEAFEVMAETYPDLAAAGTFHHGAIEDVVGRFGDGRFDAVYSVETLQHVHPDNAAVFGEIARITGDVLLTVEIEDGGLEGSDVTYVDDDVPLYHRDWNRVFTDRGFVEVESEPLDRDTLRLFRREGR